jgi:hypothetical protein
VRVLLFLFASSRENFRFFPFFCFFLFASSHHDGRALSEGGFFNGTLTFPTDYPMSPPTMKFTTKIWHPNVYEDGRVCISILHPPGDDEYGYEKASERWNPIHTVESIILSVITMLASPNDESPANIDGNGRAPSFASAWFSYTRRLLLLHGRPRASDYLD